MIEYNHLQSGYDHPSDVIKNALSNCIETHKDDIPAYLSIIESRVDRYTYESVSRLLSGRLIAPEVSRISGNPYQVQNVVTALGLK